MASKEDDTETVAVSEMTYAEVLETGTLVKEGFLMKRPSRHAPHVLHNKHVARVSRPARLFYGGACETQRRPPLTRRSLWISQTRGHRPGHDQAALHRPP